MEEMAVLTSSLEDYLEVISELAESHEEVRASMIARELDVKRPSVTYALHLLADRGLVEYAPYGPIFLTEEGQRGAQDVRRRHRALRIFLENMLGVEHEKADDFACKIEHTVDQEITSRLVEFMDFLEHSPAVKEQWRPRAWPEEAAESAEGEPEKSTAEQLAELKAPVKFLSEMKPGSTAFVTRVMGDARKRHRLTEMGFTRNATVRVVRVAPLGDPLEVEIKGYRLSLSQKDTKNILVVPCE